MKRLFGVLLLVGTGVFGFTAPAFATNDGADTVSQQALDNGSVTETETGGTATEQVAAAGCSGGWTDSTVAVKTTIYRNTQGNDLMKEVDRVQYFYPNGCGDTNLYNVTAVRAACSVRNLNSNLVTGVKVTECALGRDGGAALTVGGPFLDGGTCCANGFSPFRYAHYDPDNDNIGFRARCTCAFRSRGTGILYTYNSLTASTSHNWIFG